MLTLRKRILIIIGSIIAIIGAILLWVFFRDKPTVPNQITPTEESVDQFLPVGEVEFKKPDNIVPEQTQAPANPDETYAKQTAHIFVERFWSYSNQNDNQHIDDAILMSSPAMHDWIFSQSREQSLMYQGMTTEVLSSRILSYTREKASVEIGARQTSRLSGEDGRITEETKNIIATVDLVKAGDQWLVNGLWENN